ncbi:MAG: hypothetical protein AAF790_04155 [Planctomycetota bacterium]
MPTAPAVVVLPIDATLVEPIPVEPTPDACFGPGFVQAEIAPSPLQPLGPPPAATPGFTAFPYAGGENGFRCCGQGSAAGAKPWLGRVGLEIGDAGGGVDRTGFRFLLEGEHGFGVGFDWNLFTEELPGGGHDELHLGEVNLLYRLIETDRTLIRAGVGAAWLGDAHATDAGVNFTLMADHALADPLVLSAEIDFGTLGDAQTLHAAAGVGVMLDRCEVFGGYDYRRIGDVELKGPMVGLRFWW